MSPLSLTNRMLANRMLANNWFSLADKGGHGKGWFDGTPDSFTWPNHFGNSRANTLQLFVSSNLVLLDPECHLVIGPRPSSHLARKNIVRKY